MKIDEYLTRLKALARAPTVYATAQLLELPDATVRAWALGHRLPDNEACYRIAEALDLPPLKVIADIEAERTDDPNAKERWENRAKKSEASPEQQAQRAPRNEIQGATGEADETHRPKHQPTGKKSLGSFLQLLMHGFALAPTR